VVFHRFLLCPPRVVERSPRSLNVKLKEVRKKVNRRPKQLGGSATGFRVLFATMDPRISIIILGVKDLERSLRFYGDGLGLLMEAGVTAIIQPGGSVQDQQSIDAVNLAGAAMVFTGRRHFKH
jgi:hypothetical protein